MTFWHWTGITFYTSTYVLAESCVFDKQSPPFLSLRPRLLEADLIPKLRSLLCQVPYPLVVSIVLVFSTYPPVSVLGTGCIIIMLESFLDIRTIRINQTFIRSFLKTHRESYVDLLTTGYHSQENDLICPKNSHS